MRRFSRIEASAVTMVSSVSTPAVQSGGDRGASAASFRAWPGRGAGHLAITLAPGSQTVSRVLSAESIRSLAFATAVTLLVTGCILGGESQDEHLVFEGRVYVARGSGSEVPFEHLTIIGTTTEVRSSEPIDHADVYAVEGVDSDLVIAAVIFAVGYEELPAGTPRAGKPDVDYFQPFARLYLRRGEARYPEAACVYFDPNAEGVHGRLAPEECR